MQAIFNNFGIYVHVPFCTSACGYCRFYKQRANEADMGEYVKHCAAEIKLLRETSELPKVNTMFWGGGTPSALSERNIVALSDALEGLKPEQEWTVEVSPSSLTREKLQLLREIGVTRISLGVQSFNEKTLRTLGRAHTLASTLEAIELVASSGIANFSIDLIFGAKGQSESEWLDDMRKAAACPVNHISAYCLEFESGTSCCGGIADKAEIAKRGREGDFFEDAMRTLPELGFAQYEISNYARKGGECLHNLSTWHMAQWVGIGPAAASQFDGLRRRNTPNQKKWAAGIDARAPVYEDIVKLDDEEMFSSALIFGLRMNRGVDVETIAKRFPKASAAKYTECIKFLTAKGLLENSGSNVRLTENGRLLADSVAVELL